MATTVKTLKRWARSILKDELADLKQELVHTHCVLNTVKAQQAEAVRELERVQRDSRSGREAMQRAIKAEAWARKYSMGNNAALALAQWVSGQGTTAGFGDIHPFDRWGITPKP